MIDTQFGPLWGTYKKEETISAILRLIEKAKKENILIVYTQHEDEANQMAVGSFTWQFAAGIEPGTQDIVIHKQSTDAFCGTQLQEELQRHGITHLVVVGTTTQYCVDTTCRAAISHGYDVTLIEDGHTTIDGVIPAEEIIKHHNYNLSGVFSTKNLYYTVICIYCKKQYRVNEGTEEYKSYSYFIINKVFRASAGKCAYFCTGFPRGTM